MQEKAPFQRINPKCPHTRGGPPTDPPPAQRTILSVKFRIINSCPTFAYSALFHVEPPISNPGSAPDDLVYSPEKFYISCPIFYSHY